MILRLLIAFALFLPLTSCESQSTREKTKPFVLVSVSPYVYFVQQIARDSVDVAALVPRGANPHIYEPTPREVERHQNADLWVRLGESFDTKVAKVLEQQKTGVQILDITQGIPLLSLCDDEGVITEGEHCHTHDHDEGKDLHIWLSPKLAKLQAQKIAQALVALLPEQREVFWSNLEVFLKELDALDQEITKKLTPMQGKAILVSHPAFGYFCQDYRLIQLSIEMEGKEPLPQYVFQILEKTKRYSIQSVLLEPQYSNKGAELIAESLHLRTHMVDPYAENYTENLREIAQAIAE